MDIIARRPGPSVQEVFEKDSIQPPAILRTESPAQNQPTDDILAERYFSRRWHELEVEKVWRKTWQFACRVEHIPNVGDQCVYEIVDDSVLLVRTAPDTVKAYINSCLHRGTLLRTETGNAKQIRCPFHGWTWNLDGTLRLIPGQWDFPHVEKGKFCLPELQVGICGGFVFVVRRTAGQGRWACNGSGAMSIRNKSRLGSGSTIRPKAKLRSGTRR